MSLIQRIETLRKRHAELDGWLSEEEHRPLPDITRVRQFKREKLKLKDKIFSLAHADSDSNMGQQRQRA
ncbi:MAG: YdcH family protein [Alphaproteobacteria bacterium]